MDTCYASRDPFRSRLAPHRFYLAMELGMLFNRMSDAENALRFYGATPTLNRHLSDEDLCLDHAVHHPTTAIH